MTRKRNQMERILAAPGVNIGGAGQATLTFTADQGQVAYINRMCLVGFTSAAAGAGPGATGNTANALGSSLVISSIIIRNTTQMVRSTAAPPNVAGMPFNAFSPFRAYTGQGAFADQGQGLRLEAGETVTVQVQNLSDLPGGILGGIPTVLDCDKGKAAYPAGFDARKGSAVLASAVVAAGGLNPSPFGGQLSNPINLAVQWPEAGGLDLSHLLIGASGENAYVGAATNTMPITPPNSLILNQITLIDQSIIVTGQGNVQAPGAMVWGGSSGSQLENNWVRLPYQSGTSGNQVIVAVQANYDSAAVTDVFATASGPFYPSVGSKPPIGCI